MQDKREKKKNVVHWLPRVIHKEFERKTTSIHTGTSKKNKQNS